MTTIAATGRTTIRRLPARGSYDRDVIYSILDEALVCHVGFVIDGTPYVIPTGFGRVDDRLYIHGSAASRMLRSLTSGVEVCVTVTILDGLVLARSAFHHSMNYRSVVVLGRATEVSDAGEKLDALSRFVEHVIPGRTAHARMPNADELRKTLVLALPLDEVSAKIRTGPPVDDQEDYGMDVWAGVLPLRLTAEAPIPDPRLSSTVSVPMHVSRYQRG